jgi:hypothetical protein
MEAMPKSGGMMPASDGFNTQPSSRTSTSLAALLHWISELTDEIQSPHKQDDFKTSPIMIQNRRPGGQNGPRAPRLACVG